MSEAEVIPSSPASNGEVKLPPPPLGPRAISPPQGLREMPTMPLALLEDDVPHEGLLIGAADFGSMRVLIFIAGHPIKAKHPDGRVIEVPPVMAIAIAAVSDAFALLSFADVEPEGKGTGSTLARGAVPIWIVHPRGWFTRAADGKEIPRYRIACGDPIDQGAAKEMIDGWRKKLSEGTGEKTPENPA
jgi:hypothetical protein